MEVISPNYDYITDQSDIPLIIADARKEKYIGLDTENSGGLDVLSDTIKLLLLQIEIGGKVYVIDTRKINLDPLKEILENDYYIKVIQNSLYDYKILSVLRSINIRGIYDTKIAEYLLNVGISRDGYGLSELSFKYLDNYLDKEVVKTFFDFPYDGKFTDKQLEYAATDALVLSEIRKRQKIYLDRFGLNSTAFIEFALVPSVAKMELAGVKLDAKKWRYTLNELHKKIFKVTNDLHQVLPDPPAPVPKPPRLKKDGTPYSRSAKQKPAPILNLNSPQQLVWACSEVGIDFVKANKKTKAGLTNNTTLRAAISIYRDEPDKFSILKDIVRYRGLKQTEETFGENLIEFVGEDGRIHARFHQNGTHSGRFSSSKPNLQNIQKKGEEGKILRSCFVPETGHKFVIADYSQIELRIVAELSGDKNMLSILNNPHGDIHKSTASQMFGVPYNRVTSELRRAAKTLNFGIIYGMSAKTLSDKLGCSIEIAKNHLMKYSEAYPILMGWLDRIGIESFQKGFAKTIGGRIRWFPSLDRNSEDFKSKKAFYERVGRNHPVQGCSADMTKLSMIYLEKYLDKFNAKIVNCIHDELCVEVPFEHAVDVAKLIKKKMIVAGEYYLKQVPVLVEVKIRDCWFKDDDISDDENGQQLQLF